MIDVEEQLKLTDLIEVETLQRIQDSFCDICNLSIGICDESGVNVTKDTIASEFCTYNKQSPIGRARCAACDKRGGELALEAGKAVTYNCHAGLVDFAAPIVAHGKKVGAITGGQVRTGEIDEDYLRQIAKEIEVDPDEYVKAARKIRHIDEDELTKCANFLYRMSKIISNMAYDRYELIQANEEIERAAQMKSDFLANMSHEIRTPMNAVVGMAELALREDLSSSTREYIEQIISSGKTLLTIINDILDFSKIDAGKLQIDEEEYEPMSLINDVAHIVITRIGDKDVELNLDIAPTIPRMLVGDVNRLKQVIINITNNAVKFTNKGQVVVSVDYEKTSDETLDLIISVEDTGIGIKKQDLEKLFDAFMQVDSKRNRNIEGTGLGLAISKRIINALGGEIWVESEYGKGSKFSFRVPQKIFNEKPSVVIKKKEEIKAAGLIANGYLRKHLESDMEHLGISYSSFEKEEDLHIIEETGVKYLFIGEMMFSDEVMEFVKKHPDINAILLIDFKNSIKLDIPNLRIIKKPVYVLNIAAIFNGEEVELHRGLKSEDFEFIAPDAEILIVDDNAVNLTVAEGLLKPLQMNIDTANGGIKAVEMISKKKYDLIFMDHMMPEVDGVEATHLIRRFHPEYKDTPIIALTANAVSGTKEMFLREGMNDFVAKPIEMRVILSKLRTWLPKDKVKKVYREEKEVVDTPSEHIYIEGLDTGAALKLLGTEELFWKVLKDYYKVIDKKYDLIKQCVKDKEWSRYTIEVHGLKSASKQIGAGELSTMAAELEMAGNRKDEELIYEKTEPMLKKYLSYKEILMPYFVEEEKKSKGEIVISKEEFHEALKNIAEALDELDMDKAEEILDMMDAYIFDENEVLLLNKLREAAGEYDVEAAESIITELKEKHNN